MFTYYDDQKTFDLCINLSRGYKEKRKKKQRKEKRKKERKKEIDMSRLSIDVYTMCVSLKVFPCYSNQNTVNITKKTFNACTYKWNI